MNLREIIEKNNEEIAIELYGKNITVSPEKRIYAAFDLGWVSTYSHLFGWLKGRTLKELVDCEGEQKVLGKSILSGGVSNGRTYVIDKNGVLWLQGLHPSARLSHVKMQSLATALWLALKLFK